MELVKAKNMKSAFQNMFNLYAHELSEYNPWLATQIDENGNYLTDTVQEYMNKDSFESYCIVEKSKPIGIVIFSSERESNIWYHDIEELFLVKTSRHYGIAENICKDFWDNNEGKGTFCVLPDNHTALHFWDDLLARYGYHFSKCTEDGMVKYLFSLSKE